MNVKGDPLTVPEIVPVRDEEELFAATEYDTVIVPDPVPVRT